MKTERLTAKRKNCWRKLRQKAITLNSKIVNVKISNQTLITTKSHQKEHMKIMLNNITYNQMH